MNIAVIGGGINGIMTAWELIKLGHSVTLFEKGEVMQQTSSASSKLLHGGLRYLKNFEFRLVNEALHERQWWIKKAPDLAKQIKLYIPIYKTSRRQAWMVKIGLWVYDLLAGKQNIGKHQSLTKQRLQQSCPQLKTEGLINGFSFYDAQMDDLQLGLWALKHAGNNRPCEDPSDVAIKYGLTVLENTDVKKIDPLGNQTLADGTTHTFDKIINIAGPWAEQLLKQSNIKQSNIKPKYNLDLVRGSHILVDSGVCHCEEQTFTYGNLEERDEAAIQYKEVFIANPEGVAISQTNRHCERGEAIHSHGYLLEIPNERRIFFVLPYRGKTLIGTTEVRQNLNEPIQPSKQEVDYLISAYNHYFKTSISESNIVQTFSGLRPLIKGAQGPSKATLYTIQKKSKRNDRIWRQNGLR